MNDTLRYTRTLDPRPPPLPDRRPEITVTAPADRQDYLHPVMHTDYLTPSLVANDDKYLSLVAGRDTLYPDAPAAPNNNGEYIHPVARNDQLSYLDDIDDYQEAR